MMSAAVKGKSLDETRQLIRAFKALMSIHESKLEGESDGSDLAADLDGVRLGDLEALQGVVKFPVRIKCATLAWNTLQQALDEAAADRRREPSSRPIGRVAFGHTGSIDPIAIREPCHRSRCCTKRCPGELR